MCLLDASPYTYVAIMKRSQPVLFFELDKKLKQFQATNKMQPNEPKGRSLRLRFYFFLFASVDFRSWPDLRVHIFFVFYVF